MKLPVVISIAMLVGCGGGGGGGDDGGGPDAGVSPKCMEATQHDDLAWIQSNVFSTSCTFSACHKSPATDANGLVLEAGQSHGELVNQQSVEQSGMMLVVPGQPNQSYLMVALGQIGGTLPQDGVMPLNSPALCGEKLDAIERWILAGALE